MEINHPSSQSCNSLNRIYCIMIFYVFTLAFAVFSISAGTLPVSFNTIAAVLFHSTDDPLISKIIWDIRLPRIGIATLVGMNLALAGALLQGILRNPLASPQVIGVNAGAGLAAVIMMVYFPGRMEMIPLAAFAGAFGAAMLVYGLSSIGEISSETNIVLAGMCIAALFTAFTSGFMILHSDELEITYSWLIGGLSGKGWSYLYILCPYSLAGGVAAIWLSPKINLFLLGEEVGKSLGLSVKLYRAVILAIAAILAGSAVSVAGTIGFVGLIAPHIARLLVGGDYRYLILLAGSIGSGLLLVADTLARTIFQPVELPVGVITAVIGAPFFLYLLCRGK